MPRILAAADLGSNTAHILVAEVGGRELVRKVSDANDWISLGEIVSRLGYIPESTLEQLRRALAGFRRLAHLHRAEALYVFGTEALRKAENRDEVLSYLRDETGIAVDLIAGEREAELGLKGAWIDGAGEVPLLLVEVGGGSAQIARCQSGPTIESENSLPLGTGTLIGQFGLGQPASSRVVSQVWDHIRDQVSAVSLAPCVRMLACGGVARGLWRAVHPDGDPTLYDFELEYLIEASQRLPVEAIAQRFDVKLKRAATLLPGALVYREAMRLGGFRTMQVSRYGVREGALIDLLAGRIIGCAP